MLTRFPSVPPDTRGPCSEGPACPQSCRRKIDHGRAYPPRHRSSILIAPQASTPCSTASAPCSSLVLVFAHAMVELHLVRPRPSRSSNPAYRRSPGHPHRRKSRRIIAPRRWPISGSCQVERDGHVQRLSAKRLSIQKLDLYPGLPGQRLRLPAIVAAKMAKEDKARLHRQHACRTRLKPRRPQPNSLSAVAFTLSFELQRTLRLARQVTAELVNGASSRKIDDLSCAGIMPTRRRASSGRRSPALETTMAAQEKKIAELPRPARRVRPCGADLRTSRRHRLRISSLENIESQISANEGTQGKPARPAGDGRCRTPA